MIINLKTFANDSKNSKKGFKISKKAARKTADMVFKHASSCRWPYNFTKAEFESFHGMKFWFHQNRRTRKLKTYL